MKNSRISDALVDNLPATSTDDAFAIDLVDADFDAVAGGASSFCGVMSVDCKGTFKVSSEAE